MGMCLKETFVVHEISVLYVQPIKLRGQPLTIWGGIGNREKKIRRPFSRKKLISKGIPQEKNCQKTFLRVI